MARNPSKRKAKQQNPSDQSESVSVIVEYNRLTDGEFAARFHANTVKRFGLPQCVRGTAGSVEFYNQLLNTLRNDPATQSIAREHLRHCQRQIGAYIRWLKENREADGLRLLPYAAAMIDSSPAGAIAHCELKGDTLTDGIVRKQWDRIVDELRALAAYLDEKSTGGDRHDGLTNPTDRLIAPLLDDADEPMTANEIAAAIHRNASTVYDRLKVDAPLHEAGYRRVPHGQGYVSPRKS